MPEVNYQFRERMLQVHKPDRRMPWAVCGNDQVEVTSGWRICIPDRKDPVLYNAARDLEDYFAVSMGVYPGVAVKAEGKNVIEYRIDPLQIFLIYPAIVLGVTVFGALLTSLRIRSVSTSECSNID